MDMTPFVAPVITVLIPVVIAFVKAFMSEPTYQKVKPLIPAFAVALGPALEGLADVLTAREHSAHYGLLYGAGGIALREVIDQVRRVTPASPAKRLLVPVLVALFAAGCVSTNISELVDAMAKDPATVCWTITSVYGTVKGYRTAILNGTVTCNQDGLAVKAGTAGSSEGSVVVPVTVPPMTLTPAPPR